jgi:uncharacterized transporter YbjL
MDPITFYFIVLSCLSAAPLKFSGLPVLLGIGNAVGIFAAIALPYIKDVRNVYWLPLHKKAPAHRGRVRRGKSL